MATTIFFCFLMLKSIPTRALYLNRYLDNNEFFKVSSLTNCTWRRGGLRPKTLLNLRGDRAQQWDSGKLKGFNMY